MPWWGPGAGLRVLGSACCAVLRCDAGPPPPVTPACRTSHAALHFNACFEKSPPAAPCHAFLDACCRLCLTGRSTRQ